jgi:hypothetical protein
MAGSGNSLLDYIRNGINNSIAQSPLNPLKPADQALAYANQKMSAADQLAKLQKDGPPNALQYQTWQDKMADLKKQMAAGPK